jgi:hypothetical protein
MTNTAHPYRSYIAQTRVWLIMVLFLEPAVTGQGV